MLKYKPAITLCLHFVWYRGAAQSQPSVPVVSLCSAALCLCGSMAWCSVQCCPLVLWLCRKCGQYQRRPSVGLWSDTLLKLDHGSFWRTVPASLSVFVFVFSDVCLFYHYFVFWGFSFTELCSESEVGFQLYQKVADLFLHLSHAAVKNEISNWIMIQLRKN